MISIKNPLAVSLVFLVFDGIGVGDSTKVAGFNPADLEAWKLRFGRLPCRRLGSWGLYLESLQAEARKLSLDRCDC